MHVIMKMGIVCTLLLKSLHSMHRPDQLGLKGLLSTRQSLLPLFSLNKAVNLQTLQAIEQNIQQHCLTRQWQLEQPKLHVTYKNDIIPPSKRYKPLLQQFERSPLPDQSSCLLSARSYHDHTSLIVTSDAMKACSN